MLGDSVRRRRSGRKRRADVTAAPTRKGRGARFWVPALLGALLVPFAVGYLVATQMLFPPAVMADAGIPVPDLRGMGEVEVRMALAQAGLGAPELSTLPHPDVAAGQAVAQDPLPGQQLRPGAGVRVALSSGAPMAAIPDVRGFDADRAGVLLERLGYQVERTQVESPAPAGRVMAVTPEPGTSVRVPSTVTLVVSLGPPEPDPMAFPWDSAGGAPPDTALGRAGLLPPRDTAARDTLADGG